MKPSSLCRCTLTTRALAIVAIALVAGARPADAQAARGAESALVLFQSGDFPAAAAAFEAYLAANPTDLTSKLNLGAIRLYQNDLQAAEPLLRSVLAVYPGNARAIRLLTELDRRRSEAARRTSVDGGEAIVPFVTADPLPVVRVVANGKAANFVVDTGADVDLEPSFAASIGVKTESAGTGTFAGGKQAPMQSGTLQSLALGGATAHDVPVHVLATNTSALFPTTRIDGVVGTTYFERFLVTIDYPQNRLILRPRSKEGSAAFQDAAAALHTAIVPCYLVGDHFVMAPAQVDDTPVGLYLFDSGLAGGGLMPSELLVEAARIQLDQSHAGSGIGAGGAVRAVPFAAPPIVVGSTVRGDVRGLFTPEGSPFGLFSFTVWGAISNDFLRHYAYTVDFDAMKLDLTD
jgi:Aspartyl protease/Tetratricopeptide repeat